jgi:hypothetical protein
MFGRDYVKKRRGRCPAGRRASHFATVFGLNMFNEEQGFLTEYGAKKRLFCPRILCQLALRYRGYAAGRCDTQDRQEVHRTRFLGSE